MFAADPTGHSITVSINVGSTIVNGNTPGWVVVATPIQKRVGVDLVVSHTTYSTLWQGSNGDRHVVVDGMLNGWLMPSGSPKFVATYTPNAVFAAGQWISVAALFVAVLLVAWGWRRHLRIDAAFRTLTRLKPAVTGFSREPAAKQDDG